MKWGIAFLILLLTGDFQMQIQVLSAATSTKFVVITKPMPSATSRHYSLSTKKKVTASLAKQNEKLATSRIVGTKTEFNSSFWNTNRTTVSISAHQGLFNLNRPKIRYRNNDAQRLKKQRIKQQKRRKGNKNTKVDVRRTTLKPTTANTFQYKRYMENKWETPTVVFVKVWTKASTQNFYHQRSRKPGGPVFITTTYYPRTAPTRGRVNQWIPSQPLPMSTPNFPLSYEENYDDNKAMPTIPPRNNGQITPPGGDEYEDQPLIFPTKSPVNNFNRNPIPNGPGLKPNIKTPEGYDDEEYDDPIINAKQTTRVIKIGNADQEYEEDNEDDYVKTTKKTAGSKTALSKKTTEMSEDEEYEMPTTILIKTTAKSKTTAKISKETAEEEEEEEEKKEKEEVEEEDEDEDEETKNKKKLYKAKEEEMNTIITTQMYVPDVPTVTSRTVTFPKNLDKNAPDPDYKDKTVNLEDLYTTQKYTVKKVNIFDPNFGKE